MKTNRQKKNSRAPSHRFSNQFLPNTFLPPPPPLPKLHTLLTSFQNQQTITLLCQGHLDLRVEYNQPRVQTTNHKKISGGCTFVQPGTELVLETMIARHLLHPEETFVFAAKAYHQSDVPEFRTSSSNSKNSFLHRTATEKDFKFPETQNSNFNTSSQSSNRQSFFGCPEKEDKPKHPLSSKKKGQYGCSHPRPGTEMFTVQEIKESMQSQPRQSLRPKEKENMNCQVTEAEVEPKQPRFTMNIQGPVSFAEEHQQMPVDTHEVKIREPEQIAHQDVAIKITAPPPASSLNSHLQKGLIQEMPLEYESQSFKIAGDRSIEAQKLDRGADSKIEELSSIISEPMDPKEAEGKQIDSLRKEIEDINHCFLKKGENNIQKVSLGSLGQQREAAVKDAVQISQKGKENAMQVRYNLRFLADRSKGTEVIRLSPLRFRKKQEVVQQLVKTRLVPKESDSIHIP